MADRYFVETHVTGDRAALVGPEAHHLIHVMRAQIGARVVLFDGSGAEFAARVERIGRAEVELSILARDEIDRELPAALTLGVALPKGDRQKWLVEKAVELGVGRLVPLATARSVAQPVESALERLRRSVIEASKQCGRNRLMEIGQPRRWDDFVADGGEVPCRWLAQPGGFHKTLDPLRPDGDTAGQALLAVGPEGGLTDDEVALAVAAGWHTIDLGPRILRVETAAVMLSALLARALPGT